VTKSGLFKTLKKFYEDQGLNTFEFVPETHIIDLNFTERTSCLQRFEKVYNGEVWIIKPGEGTNRGHGI